MTFPTNVSRVVILGQSTLNSFCGMARAVQIGQIQTAHWPAVPAAASTRAGGVRGSRRSVDCPAAAAGLSPLFLHCRRRPGLDGLRSAEDQDRADAAAWLQRAANSPSTTHAAVGPSCVGNVAAARAPRQIQLRAVSCVEVVKRVSELRCRLRLHAISALSRLAGRRRTVQAISSLWTRTLDIEQK